MKELTPYSENYIAPEAISICIEPSKSILDPSPTVENPVEDPDPIDLNG